MKKIANYQLPLTSLFQNFITKTKTGKRLNNAGKRICFGTIEQYQNVLKLLFLFEELYSTKLRIQVLNKGTQRIFLREKHYWERFFRRFSSLLYQKNYYDAYVGGIFKTLKSFFNYLTREECLIIGNFHLQFRVPSQKIVPIVLEPYQLKYLITNAQFKSSLKKNLQRVNDIFVLGCTIGLRYSDLMSLKKTDIQYTDTGVFALLNTSKTATHVKIPLPQYAIDIIIKYDKKRSRFVLPRLSNTNLNVEIKKLMEKAGWTYNLPKIRYQQGVPMELKNNNNMVYRFCDHISTHTMRRTAITTLLLMGVEENIVRSISGHAPGSREFYKYVAIVQSFLTKQVLTAFDKLLLE